MRNLLKKEVEFEDTFAQVIYQFSFHISKNNECHKVEDNPSLEKIPVTSYTCSMARGINQ
ncbi:hypothetical protein QG37_05953 [Candidozyma auris]|uniref:Uncharacterized protein n=1 Tax=Candidozyma auris TaxID=498019 RepID=A0A0L0NV58_CANAR|nr:hypothetical protein QG37_05953 [[Candida] auris]